MRDEVLKTKINSSVLYELGGMYTSISHTLREFVQNSFDSLANYVDINIDIINDVITITDDGIGMNDYIVRNHYKNVGFSSKKDISIDEGKMPIVPSELLHNLKRPKIGSKGMGKLSWILIADNMETITRTIDMDQCIKVSFLADDLENNKLSYISGDNFLKHGTKLILKGLKIKDFTTANSSDKNSSNDLEELTNTIGFLGVAFPDFRIYLSVNSKNKITKRLIIKKLGSGSSSIIVKDNSIFNYKTKDGNTKEVPYDFLLVIPDRNVSDSYSSEFWLLSQYMGVKKLDIKGLSGYINIDNVSLVANRNDLQASEYDLYKELKNKICSTLVTQLAIIYRNDVDKKKISILDQNQHDLFGFINGFAMYYSRFREILPFFKFKFYLDGEHRLKDFEKDEETIYYYSDNNVGIADKASYCGYKCFNIGNNLSVNAFNFGYPISNYIQNIEKLPKDAYQSVGSSISPIGGLKDILGNLGPIFDSLAFAIVKINNNITKMKNELPKFNDVQKKERMKEIANLEAQLSNLIGRGTGVNINIGHTGRSNIDNSIDNNVDNNKTNSLRLEKEHYIRYNILDREYLIGFASLEDKDIIANIVGNRYITFNLKNEYIKDVLTEKNPIRQIIMLLPHICHEICHEWTNTHDEVFQMMFNALLIPALDCLTRKIFDGDLDVKEVDEISIDDEGKAKKKGFYDSKPRCSICSVLLARPETIKAGICGGCNKKLKSNDLLKNKSK